MRLKEVIEKNDNLLGRTFDFSVQFLIVLSIVTSAIETLPDLTDTSKYILSLIELIIVILFTIEYILRLYVASKKLSYLFSFYGIIDLVAIIPFYLASSIDLRALRIFRMLRLFRLMKLARYSSAMNRFTRAFKIAKEEIILFSVVTLMLLYLSAVGIYYFENEAQPEAFKSIFHSLWWASSTLTTVGYGDVYPITNGGKVFTFIILMIGLGIVAVPAGLLHQHCLKQE
jgi:voltage-gated potassium channel